MPARKTRRPSLPEQRSAEPEQAQSTFLQRTSIRWKILRQSMLLVTFCVLLLGGLSFFNLRFFQNVAPTETAGAILGLDALSFTILILSGLLMVLALLLGTLLARGLTSPLLELSTKVAALRPGSWAFDHTVHTGDEVEGLDRVIADLTLRLRHTYDTLEDKVAERTEELRQQYAMDRAILESIEYGVVAIDAKGKVTDINPSGSRLLQLEKEKAVGKMAVDILPYIQRKHQFRPHEHPIAIVLKDGKPYRSHPDMHPNLLRQDERLLPVTLAVTPLLDGKEVRGAIAVFQDMSEERQIDYMKSEFISLASHQLRTPISSIRWYVELIDAEEKKALTPIQRGYFKEIAQASGRMANLLEALLHVARLEGGAITPEFQKVELHTLVLQMAEEWKIMARERGLKLVASIPSKVILTTDAILLQVVLQNFFSNAFKYSPRNKEVNLRIREEQGHVIISVQDQGMGIPAEEHRRLFEKFFRAHNVRKIDTDGSGLGLYISKTIAEKLGGSIYFESQEGRGSTFTLVLPAK